MAEFYRDKTSWRQGGERGEGETLGGPSGPRDKPAGQDPPGGGKGN